MPSAELRGITKFFMPYKTKQNKIVKTLAFFSRNVNRCRNELRQTLRANKFYYLRIYSSILKILSLQNEKLDEIEFN